MPWTEEELMEKKERFVELALSGKFYISDLSQQYGIIRKTAHKYLKRYKAEGKLGLQERSRCPLGYALG
ncbi:MAG: leucine zipper domain-containing protein [Puniceicoccaceae bacterium]